MRFVARLGALAFLTAVAGCGGEQPGPGTTWAIDAVDRSGAFGTITIERGDVVPLPAALREDAFEKTHGMLVRIAYAPDRDSDTGFGSFDWGASVGAEETDVAEASSRTLTLDGRFDWPVEPPLGMLLPGGADPVEGWIAIAVSQAELDGRVVLRYQPFLVDLGNGGSTNELVTEVVIHAP